MRSTMMEMPLSLNTLLERAGQYFRDTEVLSRGPDKSVSSRSYGEVYRRARQLAQALRSRAGVKTGDAVATLCWNHAWHLECYFGIPAAGAVTHTLNLRLSAEDLAYIIEDAGDTLLLVDDVLLPIWERVKPLLKRDLRVVVIPFSGEPVPEGYERYEDFIDLDASAYQYPDVPETSAAAMCYTSGTTGRPKGVVYSHRSMVLHAVTGCMPDIFALSCRDRVLLVTPMFHANAWAVPYSAMMVGATLVMPGPHLGGEDLLDLIESTRATMSLGVPTVWMMVLQALEKPTRQRDLPSGIRMLVAGSAVPIALIERFAHHGMQVMQGWGMTEMSPLGTFGLDRPSHAALTLAERHALTATQGVPVPLVDLRLVDEHGQPQPWDGVAVGEVQVRGNWVAASYHGLAPTSDKFTGDGWLRTGDMAILNAEGHMRIVDRSKDLIKSGGEWISSVDLENLVMGHPGVAEAAVVAIPHPKWDERPLVVVVRKPGAEVDSASLREYLALRLARFQIPDDYEWVDQLPKTSTGKFLKVKLRDLYRDRISQTA